MNIIEYGYYDIASNENETKDALVKGLEYKPSVISVLPYYIKLAQVVCGSKARVSCIIDYPFGLSDTESRLKAVELALKSKIDILEIICPTQLLCNRKYDKFRKELEICSKLCKEASVELRYILEYKIFMPELLYKAANILTEFGVYTAYPSANYLMDNISDNILAAMLISQKNPNINIIVNGSAWTDDHIRTILDNNKIHGYRTSNIFTLEKITKKSQNYI
jgi:hypothetical protein